MRLTAKTLILYLAGAYLALSSLYPIAAHADVRKTDVVLGGTVEELGLTVADCPNIEADYAIVMGEDGSVYYERDADAAVQVASITKIMTAVTALDSVPLDTQIHVSEKAAYIGESSAYLVPGDVLTLGNALVALMVPSGNDAAQAIAESIGRIMLESEGADASDPDACCNRFVQAMNDEAAEIGLANSLWTNPHGLDDGEYESDQHSCARDIATLSAYAMQKQAIRDVTSQNSANCEISRDGETLVATFESTDMLLGEYEGVCGVKTGFTDLAGACFAGACNRGEDIYAIALHSIDEWERFVDVSSMWDWYYSHCIDLPLANSNTYTVNSAGETLPAFAAVPAAAWMDKTVDAVLADPEAFVRVFDIQGNVSQEVEYSYPEGAVHAGDVVGHVVFKQRNSVVAEMDLVAADDLAAPGLLKKVSIWWSRLVGGFVGDEGIASPKLYNQMPVINDKNAQG